MHLSVAERVAVLKEMLDGTRRGCSVNEMYAERRDRIFKNEPRVPFSEIAAGCPTDTHILAAIAEFEKQGYEVRLYNWEGMMFYEIDRLLLMEPEKMRQLGDEMLRIVDTYGAFSEGVLKFLARQ